MVKVGVMILRVPKEEAAYLYQLLESYEGLTNHSTVSLEKELPFRDVQLHMAPDLKIELLEVLANIQKEIPALVVLTKS